MALLTNSAAFLVERHQPFHTGLKCVVHGIGLMKSDENQR